MGSRMVLILIFLFYTKLSLAQPGEDFGIPEYSMSKSDKIILDSFVSLMDQDDQHIYTKINSVLNSSSTRDPLKRAILDSLFSKYLDIDNNLKLFVSANFDYLITTRQPSVDPDYGDPLYPILKQISNHEELRMHLWCAIVLSSNLRDCAYFSDINNYGNFNYSKLNLLASIFYDRKYELNELINSARNNCYKRNLKVILERISLTNKN